MAVVRYATFEAEVTRPLPLTVRLLNVPMLPPLTVASVVTSEPAVVVMSPESAGNCAACKVPVTSERLIFNVEVATHVGTPDADVVRMEELVVERVFSAVEPEP